MAATPGIWADWERDGFAGDDEITSDVIDIDISEGGAFESSGGTTPGTMTLTVKNSDGKYTRDYGSSPLFGLDLIGTPIWFGANEDGTVSGAGTVRGVFAGYVREIAPLPVAGATNTPTATILCEGVMSIIALAKQVQSGDADGLGISHASLIDAAVQSATTSVSRAIEGNPHTLHLMDTDGGADALAVIDQINTATGTRHFIRAEDDKDVFATYVSVNRWHNLDEAADEDWNADDIQAINGYRLTADAVTNAQRASATQLSPSPYTTIVWTQDQPITVAAGEVRILWIDVVPSLQPDATDYTVTGTVTAVSLGGSSGHTRLQLEIDGGVSGGTVTTWKVVSRLMVAGDPQTIEQQDAPSDILYGHRWGGDISNVYVGDIHHAKAIGQFVLWKFAQPMSRPTVTVTNMFPTIMVREPYDIIRLTADVFAMTNRRYEIIGRNLNVSLAASSSAVLWTCTYQLQETTNQSAMAVARFGAAEFGVDEFAY